MDPATSAIREAIEICMEKWPAIQLIRRYQDDPDVQVLLFAQELENYLLRFTVDEGYLSDFLSDYLDEKFNIEVEDGSIELIANTLVQVQTEAENGVFGKLGEMRKLRQKDMPEVRKVPSVQQTEALLEDLRVDESPESMSQDQGGVNPLPDDDGFVPVLGKKSRRKG